VPEGEESFGRVIRRSRNEGVQEINSAARTQDKEHNWLFLPAGELWIDTTTHAREAFVESDRYIHTFLSHLYPEVEAVHTHPDAVVAQLVEDYPWDYSQNYRMEAAQPSGDDIISHYQMVARNAPNSRQVSSIVSHYGTTSFTMRDAQGPIQGFHTESYDRLIHGNPDPVTAIRTVLHQLSEHVLRPDGTPALSITFEPITE
jgi:hypothetical protein